MQKIINLKTGLITLLIILFLELVLGYYVLSTIGNRYDNATQLYNNGEYIAAKEEFSKLGRYRDSETRVLDATYKDAEKLFANGNYDEAATKFYNLGEFKDSVVRTIEAKRMANDIILSSGMGRAIDLMNKKDYYKALKILEELDTRYQYPNAKEKVDECRRFLLSENIL